MFQNLWQLRYDKVAMKHTRYTTQDECKKTNAFAWGNPKRNLKIPILGIM